MKLLWYAFQLRQLAKTLLRSLIHYLPNLLPDTNVEIDDDDDNSMFLPNNQEKQNVDLVAPLKKSVVQIILEVILLNSSCENFMFYVVGSWVNWNFLGCF